MKSKSLIPFVAALVGSVLMIVTLFLPYATAIDDHAESIQDRPHAMVYEKIDMEAQDIMHISMVEYSYIYSNLAEQLFRDSSDAILYVIMVMLIGSFSLFAVIFSIFKKPIAVIVFDALAFCVFCMQNWDYTDRGVIPSRSYDWGAGYYIFYVAALITLVGAALMLINSVRDKKNKEISNNCN